MFNNNAIEVSDLYASEGHQVVESFSKNGFVAIRDALSQTVVSRALLDGAKLFSVEDDIRQEMQSESPGEPGLVPYGRAKALDSGIVNAVESWAISYPEFHKYPAALKSGWFVHVHLAAILRHIAEQVLIALEREMDVPGELVPVASFDDSHLEILHYRRDLDRKVQGSRRQSIHADSTVVTVQLRASAPGLMVQLGDDLVPPNVAGGDVLVVAGSVLEHVSGGAINACRHTVENSYDVNGSAERTSLVLFVPPRPDVVLKPVSSMASAQALAAYPAIAASEQQHRVSQRVFGEQ
jgi:isopenicillin N synthase-like dioxygenase